MHMPHHDDHRVEEKTAHMEKALIPREDLPEENHEGEEASSSLVVAPVAAGPVQRTGRWTPDEKILFLYGLKRFGKGRWKKMSIYLPHRLRIRSGSYTTRVTLFIVVVRGYGLLCLAADRSLVQIKSHAQKVLKRLEAGENVFRRLEENYSVVDSLIVQAAKQRDAAGPPAGEPHSTVAKRKRQGRKLTNEEEDVTITTTTPTETTTSQQSSAAVIPDTTEAEEAGDGKGAVIAAAALCQLSSLGSTWDEQQQQQQASNKKSSQQQWSNL
eukprot:scaffold1869_cov122-Cylindrotheca_fusiformis.AAC.61